jgi:hypothetical protein
MTMRAALFAVPLIALLACSAEQTPRKGFAESTAEPSTPAEEDEPVEKEPASTPIDTEDPPAEEQASPSNCKTAAPSHACGVSPQCGCAKTETCDVVDTKGTATCVAFGKATMGKPCTATAGCARGLSCVFGTCHAFCDKGGTQCSEPGTGDCVQVTAQGGTAIPNLAVCMVQCAPHDPLACGGKTNAGTGVCFVAADGSTDCQEGGSRSENQTCSPTDECGPGLVCITTTSGTGTGADACKRWCRVGTNDCGGSAVCRAFSTKVMVGTAEYGACP